MLCGACVCTYLYGQVESFVNGGQTGRKLQLSETDKCIGVYGDNDDGAVRHSASVISVYIC